ncbi:MAG: hypothetical protein GXO82_10890, partial [Chlorobi bacterium]|nr:hypothetical protein [Chlorobiota bacterium]
MLQKPLPGLVISNGPFDLFDKGLDVANPRRITLLYDPPPGFEFDHFEGDFGDQDQNPFILQIDPKLKPGEYRFNPVPRRLQKGTAELVIVNPDGPGGPVQRRITAPVGDVVNAQASAPLDYVFIGWGWDTTAVTNPLPVTLWKSKKIKAYFRKKPCVPAQMIPWKDNLTLENSRQGKVSLEYGMQPGAGDGLEAGQVDLPPIPVVGTFDIRWINIPGSQGSTTDIRAVKSTHIYQGRVQTGSGTAPVKMSWNTPILSTDYSITLKIAGVPGSIDMHSAYDYTFTSEGTYIFTIEVKSKTCPPPVNEPEVDITTMRIDPSNFPCIRFELLVKNRTTGEILPYYNPYNIKVYEKDAQGENVPPRITSIEQNGRTLVYQLCSNRKDADPVREIVIVNDNDDPNRKKDTTVVEVKIPVPDDQGKLTRIMRQNSGDWEMVSMPVNMDASLVSSLYPDPTTKLYEFNTSTGQYESAGQMEFGDGYWLKTPDEYTTFYGNEMLSHTWTGLSG